MLWTVTSSANFWRLRRNLARCIWRADSSPLPEKSVRYRAVALSTIIRANLSIQDRQKLSLRKQFRWRLRESILTTLNATDTLRFLWMKFHKLTSWIYLEYLLVQISKEAESNEIHYWKTINCYTKSMQLDISNCKAVTKWVSHFIKHHWSWLILSTTH